MELFKDILIRVIENNLTETDLKYMSYIVESESYKALKKIKTIIEDDSLEDEECFIKIEEIVRVFERIGSDCGNRHDFG